MDQKKYGKSTAPVIITSRLTFKVSTVGSGIRETSVSTSHTATGRPCDRACFACSLTQSSAPRSFRIPSARRGRWRIAVDTSLMSPDDATEAASTPVRVDDLVEVQPRTAMILLSP